MRPGEEIFTEITGIRDSSGCTLGEAVVEYAEKADCDVDEVLKMLDSTAIAQIRESLIGSIMLKPSMRARKKSVEIDFD